MAKSAAATPRPTPTECLELSRLAISASLRRVYQILKQLKEVGFLPRPGQVADLTYLVVVPAVAFGATPTS